MRNTNWLQESAELQDWLVSTRRYLHQHPGTGFDISETVDYVEKQLREMGCEPQRCGKAGLVATVGMAKKAITGTCNTKTMDTECQDGASNDKGRTILLRADMDALPIQEETELAFKATNGCMHACGHDMHATMLLGAAKLLKEHEAELQGTVKFMFQPAEEIFEGSKDMIEHGVLENPVPDAAMMIHVMAGMPWAEGTVIVSAPGVSAPAADYFEIQVQGVGCHGAMPNTGVDPITAAAHILIALQEITAREISVNDNAVLTIGQIHGGNASNVIPDRVTMGGTLRTYDEKVREYIKQRIVEISEATAAVFRAKAEVQFGSGCPTLINDKKLAEKLNGYMKDLLGEGKAFSVEQLNAMSPTPAARSSGSEDFAYVSQKVPSIMLAMAAGSPDNGYQYPQHHPKADYAEEVLAVGSAVFAYTAMRFLEEKA